MSQHPEIYDDPLDLEWPDHTKSESRPLTKEEWAMASRYVHPRARLGRTVWAWWCMVTLPCMAFLYEEGLIFGSQEWRFSPNENPFDNIWSIVLGASWACWLGFWWLQEKLRDVHKVSGRLRLLSRYRFALGNVEADHDFDDAKLVEGKFYHAVFSRSRKKDDFRALFIGPLGWGIEEKAGDNWPPRLTLFSWMLIPVFLCLHERMASFAIPAREIPAGTCQFLWYGIPHALRFQEGLTLFLYPVVGLVLLAGAVAWVRWKWRQHQEDRRILSDLGDEPLGMFWRDDWREDLRNLRPDEERIVKKLVGPRAILYGVGAGWLALHAFPLAMLWGLSWKFQGSSDLGSGLLPFIGMGELFAVLFWLFDLGRLSTKISGEFRRKSDAEVFIGSQVIRYRSKIHRPEDIRDLLEEGRFYHVVADTHGEDGDEYSIGIVANHVGVAEDPRWMPLWTLWSLVMTPVMWLLYSRTKDFQLQDGLEGLLRMGVTPKGVLLGGFEIPFVTSLSGALVVVAFLGLSGPFAWGFLKGLPWAFRKWKTRDSTEDDDLM